MKKFFSEFKEFIAQGNVIDMAVAVVVGGAFKEIVNALVNGIVMPLIGLLTGGGNISTWKWVISEATVVDGVEVPENAVLYGAFIQAIIDFLIIALCIFVVLKVFLAMQERTKKLLQKKAEEETAAAEEEAPAETEMDVLKDIRTLLTAQNEK